MPDFHAFLTQKYPLYADTEIKVNLTVNQLLELVDEFISEASPVFEVKVVDREVRENDTIVKCSLCQYETHSEINLLRHHHAYHS